MRETMAVEAILKGTVIDHVPTGQGLNILSLIQKRDPQAQITVGLNLPSKGNGKKDIIKVEGWLFSQHDAGEMALYAPTATVNVIDNYAVVKKFKIELPDQFVGLFACPNSNCISHTEPVASRFSVSQTHNAEANTHKVRLQCHFCERTFSDSLFK
ncbi:aspartate carbamoyltransferase regulatory subunit [Reinekea thalattae]|uniref:Aspartate carbamoyltransferase regulatory chain n=1 Tax=Reinekea thalattae TaxID=2593301 RepID=A0A5C8ZA46_9GAMM|nr:aspartate carbamoyltransferase regulatory subunit [Reinekea thalattae]TXR53690.1 aspartate carbamoyltransferase regulatory subunit [Reinekea thalattae]